MLWQTRLTEAQQTTALALHRKLVSIRSCNTSLEQANRDRAEAAIADYVRDYLRGIGMEVTAHEYAPGRPNLTAHWPDQQGEKTVALQAHLDTVGVEGMVRPPFDAAVESGRVYGRGACDTKGSLAAFLAALALARQAGWKPVNKWFFVATVAEETGCAGARALTESGFRVDAVVVGEPTRCRLVTAHKGQAWLRIVATGRSCHAAVPERGCNAVNALSRAIVWIDEVFGAECRRRTHPLLGRGTVSVDVIRGGTAPNIVPAHAEAMVDCRMLPDETPEQVAERLSSGLRRDLAQWAGQLRVEIDQANAGLEISPEQPFVRNLMAVCREAINQSNLEGVNYFADSAAFHAAGIQTVLFGPGDIAQAHTADEYLEIEQLYLATETALQWLLQYENRCLFD